MSANDAQLTSWGDQCKKSSGFGSVPEGKTRPERVFYWPMPAINIKVTSNVDQVTARWAQFRQRDLAVAIAKALTFTAEAVQAAEVDEMRRVFQDPTPWTLRGTRKISATPANLQAVVMLKDEAGSGTPAVKFLQPEVESGPRAHKRFELALIHRGLMPADMFAAPGSGARMDRYGNISQGQLIEILSALGAAERTLGFSMNRTSLSRARRGKKLKEYFVGRPGGGALPLGVWERRGNRVLPVLLYVKQPHYRQRLDFYGIAERVAAEKFDGILEARLASAFEKL